MTSNYNPQTFGLEGAIRSLSDVHFPSYQAMANRPISEFGDSQLSVQKYQSMSVEMCATPKKTIVTETLKLCSTNPGAAISNLLRLESNDFSAVAKDSSGSKFLQTHFTDSPALRKKLFDVVLKPDVFASFATDNFANFIVQRMIADAHNSPSYADVLFDAIENQWEQFSFHRYACRVVQKLVEVGPQEHVRRLLGKFAGQEMRVAKDQNSNHIIQRILEKYTPVVYTPFFKALIGEGEAFGSSERVASIIQDRYGCRVVQMCLEQVVKFLSERAVFDDEMRTGYELLHILTGPILRGAKLFSENEYANYIVQFVLRTPFLAVQRDYIIKHCILDNILELSQGKYSSHVVEQALVYANPNMLAEMVGEILDGYLPDKRGRDALDIMLFDQFANYVIQRLLQISIRAKQQGYPQWYVIISSRIKRNMGNLERYSSGKKILDAVQKEDDKHFAGHYQY